MIKIKLVRWAVIVDKVFALERKKRSRICWKNGQQGLINCSNIREGLDSAPYHPFNWCRRDRTDFKVVVNQIAKLHSKWFTRYKILKLYRTCTVHVPYFMHCTKLWIIKFIKEHSDKTKYFYLKLFKFVQCMYGVSTVHVQYMYGVCTVKNMHYTVHLCIPFTDSVDSYHSLVVRLVDRLFAWYSPTYWWWLTPLSQGLWF